MNLEQIIRKTKYALTIPAIALAINTAEAQNIVNVHMQSVPSMSNVRTRVKAVDGSGNPYQRMTDSTGTARLILAPGTAAITEFPEHNYKIQYTSNISGNTNIEDQAIETRTPESTLYSSWGQLLLDEYMLLRRPVDPTQHSMKWNINPIPVFNDNINAASKVNFDSVYNYTSQHTSGRFSYVLIAHDSTVGITNKFVPSDQVPNQVSGWTVIDDWFPDGSIKHVTTWYANDIGIPHVVELRTFSEELGRALELHANSQDPIFVMYNNGSGVTANFFCNDEIRIIMDNQSLKQYTDFGKFKNVIIDSVMNKSPLAFELVSPAADTNQRFTKPVTFVWNKTIDPDSDNVTYSLNVAGGGNNTTIDNLTDTTYTIPASFFKQDSTYTWNVTATDGELKTGTTPRTFTIKEASSVDDNPLANSFQLYQNYPNPFNPTTTIEYEIKNRGHVKLEITDILGREIKTLTDEVESPGRYKKILDMKDMPSGMYIYTLQTQNQNITKKMLLIK